MSSANAVRRAVVSAAVTAGLIVSGAQLGEARDQRYPLRDRTSISVVGHGYGHGRGMSQWGAYGAATAGLTYSQILAFYYPGTTLTLTTDPMMRVLVSADNDNSTKVLPVSGLSVCSSSGHRTLLSTSSSISVWRLVRVSGQIRIQWYSSGAYHTGATAYGSFATFTRSTSCSALGGATMTLVLPSGAVEGIRAGVRAQIYSTGLRTVGVMGMTSYLASVVPSEMPSGWATEALKAQSVAARSYATRYRQVSGGPTKPWDICDTTACQVFHGTSAETDATTSAVSATADRILTYQGAVALTEFSASNGGWTTSGGVPYLVAKADPYDGRVASYGPSWPNPHTWTDTVSISSLENRYPSIGTFVRLDVTARDAHGDFGGRTETVVVQGNEGHVTLSGSEFASAAGLKSIWWNVRYAGLDHDLTNDGRPDLLARERGTGQLRIYPSTSAATLAAPSVNGSGWDVMKQILVAGDLTGDGAPDIVARNSSSGDLTLYPGNSAGWVSSGGSLATGTPYSLMAAPGDFSGDGHPDLMGVDPATGALMLMRGDGAGNIGAPVKIGSGWTIMDAILGSGDINGDGYVDLLARVHSTGELRIYYGNGAGGWTGKVSTLAGSYAALTMLAVPGDLNADARPDLLGTNAAGQLLRYLGSSSGFAAGTVIGGAGWNTIDRLG
ncbi:MAG: SpoIID/LytB domain-containing protein [Actinomycetales bacterium]